MNLSECPETVLFEARTVDFWASAFTMIPGGQGIGILGSEGFWANFVVPGVICPIIRLYVQVKSISPAAMSWNGTSG